MWALLLASSAVLLASSIYRAASFPFTGDESLTFAGFSWEPIWSGDVNNHLLNTWLMRLCSAALGNSELSLRIPNLMAHAVYLASALALLKRFAQPVLVAAGFVLLTSILFCSTFSSWRAAMAWRWRSHY